MTPERIAITGSNGTIGTVLKKGLGSDYEIVEAALPEIDVRNFEQFKSVIIGSTAIIHLAWNSKLENHVNNKIDPDCAAMFINVYKAAKETGVKRVIMASSVHVDSFIGWKSPGLLTPDKTPVPDSLYGADKVFMEAAGRYFASLGLEVVCIRFGGINPQNSPSGSEYPSEERAAWLSHKDCISLVRSIIEADSVPNNFVIVYGVSDNEGRIHDISNPFGWKPRDGNKLL